MTQPTEAEALLIDKADNALLNNQQAAITDLTVTGTYATDDTPIETAINSMLAAMRKHGLIAD